MHFSQLVASCLLGLATRSMAEHMAADHYLWGPGGAVNHAKMEKRATTTTTSSTSSTSRVADSACTNNALTRSCWSSGYSVATDFDAKWPTSGSQTRYVRLDDLSSSGTSLTTVAVQLGGEEYHLQPRRQWRSHLPALQWTVSRSYYLGQLGRHHLSHCQELTEG